MEVIGTGIKGIPYVVDGKREKTKKFRVIKPPRTGIPHKSFTLTMNLIKKRIKLFPVGD
jgi:hypothetical protein